LSASKGADGPASRPCRQTADARGGVHGNADFGGRAELGVLGKGNDVGRGGVSHEFLMEAREFPVREEGERELDGRGRDGRAHDAPIMGVEDPQGPDHLPPVETEPGMEVAGGDGARAD
jgi:hypothetical protein